MEDEGHVLWGDVCGMVWGKRTTPITVPLTKERQRQTYDGAMNLRTQTVPLQEQPRGEGRNTVASLRWCQSLYPNKQFLVLGDGASSHRGAERRTFLAPENAGRAEAQGEVTWLLCAPTAPEPNPTEDVRLSGEDGSP